MPLPWETIETPDENVGQTGLRYPRPLGKTMQVVTMLTHKPSKEHMYGTVLVNDNGTFADVPGLEPLAEGYCGKPLGSLSIARQGRFLYWGYPAAPDGMTPTARAVFRNAVHYLYAKRDSATTPYVCAPRGNIANFLRLAETIEGYEAQGMKHFRNSLDPAEQKGWEPTLATAKPWLAENLPYLVTERAAPPYQVFRVDGNAKTLGTPNNRLESLEAWIRFRKDKPEARACLARYVDPGIAPKDGDWEGWLARMKGRLIFVDSAGFRFVEDPRLLSP